MGDWSGTNRLYLGDWKPEEPVHSSEATANVKKRVGDQFLEISYTWSYEGKSQEGILIFGGDNKADTVSAFWTDSWHLAHQTMLCSGAENVDGVVSLGGTYKVEGHPDWGWRTEVAAESGRLVFKMFNVSPEGEESLAVEMDLRRT